MKLPHVRSPSPPASQLHTTLTNRTTHPSPYLLPAALVWYKGAQPAGSNEVLLQVAYADESSGDLRPSATWRVGGFSDQAQG